MTTTNPALPTESLMTGVLFSEPSSTSNSSPRDNIIFRAFDVARPLPLEKTRTLASIMAKLAPEGSELAARMPAARRAVAENLYAGQPDTISILRLKAGMSQAQLADLANTTQPHIARIEQGIVDPGTDMVSRIATAIGVSEEIAFRAIRSQREVHG